MNTIIHINIAINKKNKIGKKYYLSPLQIQTPSIFPKALVKLLNKALVLAFSKFCFYTAARE